MLFKITIDYYYNYNYDDMEAFKRWVESVFKKKEMKKHAIQDFFLRNGHNAGDLGLLSPKRLLQKSRNCINGFLSIMI